MSAEPLAEWRQRIEAFLRADPGREITEDGELLFDLRQTQYRLEEAHGRLLLHLWSPERNWVRRVVGIEEESAERLVLEVERFGRARPGKLVVARPRRRRTREGDRSGARRKFAAWLRRLVEREFPRSTLENLATSPDLTRSFSGLYARARLREADRWWAILGAGAGETAATADGALTFGLLWLDWNRRQFPDRAWAGLHLFLPADRIQTTASRLTGLDPARVTVCLTAIDQEEFTATAVDIRDWGNLDTHLAPARHAKNVLAAESSGVERIRALAPEAIEAVVPAGRGELTLRFHGLEFARAASGRVTFGLGREPKLLRPDNFAALEALVERLRRERCPGGLARSPLYRLQPERWLEAQVRAHPRALDPRLDPELLYRQVPALAAGERGVADLLGVTRDGRLVVIELKASEDIHLPLQGLDYWLRVRWHQERGELAAAGYFPGRPLKPDPPELLLVSPALHFHPATETLCQYLSPRVRLTLVGLAADWRRQIKVTSRRRLRA